MPMISACAGPNLTGYLHAHSVTVVTDGGGDPVLSQICGCFVNSIFMLRGVPTTGTWQFCRKFAVKGGLPGKDMTTVLGMVFYGHRARVARGLQDERWGSRLKAMLIGKGA